MTMVRITMHFIVNICKQHFNFVTHNIISNPFSIVANCSVYWSYFNEKKTLEPVQTGFPTHLQYAKKKQFFRNFVVFLARILQ